MRWTRPLAAPLSLLLALAVVTAPAAAEPQLLFERWYTVRFEGQHAGWFHDRLERDGGELHTVQRMKLTLRRGGAPVEMSSEGRFVETEAGEAISVAASHRVGGSGTRLEVTFGPDGPRLVTEQGGRRSERALPPADGGWLPPAAAHRFVQERRSEGAGTIRYRTFDPAASLEPVEVTVEVEGEEPLALDGAVVPAVRQRVESSALPGMPTIEHVDRDGRPVRMTTRMGAMRVDLLKSDEAAARAEVDAPELIAGSLIRADFSIDRPRDLRRAAFRLRVREGRLPELPESAVQRVTSMNEQTARVFVDLDRPRREEGSAPPVRHTPMIDGRDERIVALAEEAVEGVRGGPAAEAEAMRRFVGRYIRAVDLSVGFASASEVARHPAGDCTEHAVLLAAMLKARSIPSRVASGLMYTSQFLGEQDVFAYHMWTQAWLEDRWVDLDATLGGRAAFDATHILLVTSDLEEGHLSRDAQVIAPLLGRLVIRRLPAP